MLDIVTAQLALKSEGNSYRGNDIHITCRNGERAMRSGKRCARARERGRETGI
jgi:hypothetical protein